MPPDQGGGRPSARHRPPRAVAATRIGQRLDDHGLGRDLRVHRVDLGLEGRGRPGLRRPDVGSPWSAGRQGQRVESQAVSLSTEGPSPKRARRRSRGCSRRRGRAQELRLDGGMGGPTTRVAEEGGRDSLDSAVVGDVDHGEVTRVVWDQVPRWSRRVVRCTSRRRPRGGPRPRGRGADLDPEVLPVGGVRTRRGRRGQRAGSVDGLVGVGGVVVNQEVAPSSGQP